MMKIVAHRGANRKALQNSMEAFRLALSFCDRIELDVQLAGDNSVWVMHDETLTKTTGHQLLLSNLTSHQLQNIRLLNGEPIPSLELILSDLLPRIELNIELKGSDLKLAKIVCEAILKTNASDNVIISTFYPPVLEYISKEFPNIKRAFLWGEDTEFIDKRYYDHYLKLLDKTNTRIFHPEVSNLSPTMVRILQKESISIVAWAPFNLNEVENNYALWRNLADLQIDGLCTNFPNEMFQWQQKGGRGS